MVNGKGIYCRIFRKHFEMRGKKISIPHPSSKSMFIILVLPRNFEVFNIKKKKKHDVMENTGLQNHTELGSNHPISWVTSDNSFGSYSLNTCYIAGT